jgi:nucleoside-diphosphate-sugar epimerase
VVTGGARGIGLAIARWFLAHEYRVAVWDNDVTTLNRTIAELGDGERVLGVPCDVSKPGEVQAAAAGRGPMRPHHRAREQRRRSGLQAHWRDDVRGVELRTGHEPERRFSARRPWCH